MIDSKIEEKTQKKDNRTLCDKCKKEAEYLIKTCVQTGKDKWEIKSLCKRCYDEHEKHLEALRECFRIQTGE